MGIFNRIRNEKLSLYSDSDVVSPVKGTLIPPNYINDPVFKEEMMGQTIGIIPSDNTFVCPVNGIVEVTFPTGHAYGIKSNDGKSYLVHVGIDTVSLEGKGFKSYIKKGEYVKAGQKAVIVDFDILKEANLDLTTMLIITDNLNEPIKFIEYGEVEKGQKINK